MSSKTGLALLAWTLVAGAAAAQKPPETIVTLSTLSSRAPAEWKPVPSSGQFRHIEFILPRAANDSSDAELVVFHFGAAGGGGASANVARWKGMFQDAQSTTEEFVVAGAKVTYLDLTGTYLMRARSFDPDEKPTPQPSTRMLAVVFENPGGPYYMRLVGPQKTVTHHKRAFDQWLRGFKAASR